MFFHLKLPEGWKFSKIKNKQYRKELTKLSENKILQSRPHAAMFVVSFANLKSRVLSCDPSSDHVMPSAEV